MIARARLAQAWADLAASFWLRPAVMTAAGAVLAETLVRLEGSLPAGLARPWLYGGGESGARAVLGAIAASMITVAGTVFSITVAALTLASTQMGPRLLRNFASDPGNHYALGALLGTFAYALVALRTVRGTGDTAFVPHLAVTGGIVAALACVAVLIWFIDHLARSIDVDRVVALVQGDLVSAIEAMEPLDGPERAPPAPEAPRVRGDTLAARGSGYLRVIDDGALADWAEARDACLRLTIRPGHFVFAGGAIGEVIPAGLAAEADRALARAMRLGSSRDAAQDLEHGVRQLVEIALRALSPGINDPFTAIAVVDRLGATLCAVARRRLPDGVTRRGGVVRVTRSATTYDGLLDAMFHMLRHAAAAQPAVTIRMLEVLARVAAVEPDAARRSGLRRHAGLARDAGLGGAPDVPAKRAVREAHRDVVLALAAPRPACPSSPAG